MHRRHTYKRQSRPSGIAETEADKSATSSISASVELTSKWKVRGEKELTYSLACDVRWGRTAHAFNLGAVGRNGSGVVAFDELDWLMLGKHCGGGEGTK